jgi:hypothetical protein
MSLLYNISFTDSQGFLHPSAIFGVEYAKGSDNTTLKLTRNMGNMVGMSQYGYNTAYAAARFCYWETEEQYLAGTSPYTFSIKREGLLRPITYFDFIAYGEGYNGLTLEEKCYHYLQNSLI